MGVPPRGGSPRGGYTKHYINSKGSSQAEKPYPITSKEKNKGGAEMNSHLSSGGASRVFKNSTFSTFFTIFVIFCLGTPRGYPPIGQKGYNPI